MVQTQRAATENSGFSHHLGDAASGFTLKQLLHRLEDHFPILLTGEGGLGSDGQPRSDRLQSRYDDTSLETLGPPDRLEGLFYSFVPGTKAESQKKRAWAGTLIRNALPRWRGGRAWARRAFFQLEENPGSEAFRKEVEGHSVVIAREQGAGSEGDHLYMRIMPRLEVKPRPVSLRVSQGQLLDGLGGAFPECLEGQGELFQGPDVPSDKFFSQNNFATLSTLGAEDEMLAIQYSYQLRADHKAAWDKNRQYALVLIRNIFPHWREAPEWLRNAILNAELERDQEDRSIVRAGIVLRVLHYHGNIGITVFPEDLSF